MKAIYTIGYEGADIEQFTQALLSNGIAVLADVRAVPLSRKRGFSKKTLCETLARAGIRYVHFAALGDPKEGRDAARAGEYARFRRVYASHLKTRGARSALMTLHDLAGSAETCLMCFERDPLTCHRSMIASSVGFRDMVVVDLYCDSGGRRIDAREPLPRRDFDQSRTPAQQEVR